MAFPLLHPYDNTEWVPDADGRQPRLPLQAKGTHAEPGCLSCSSENGFDGNDNISDMSPEQHITLKTRTGKEEQWKKVSQVITIQFRVNSSSVVLVFSFALRRKWSFCPSTKMVFFHRRCNENYETILSRRVERRYSVEIVVFATLFRSLPWYRVGNLPQGNLHSPQLSPCQQFSHRKERRQTHYTQVASWLEEHTTILVLLYFLFVTLETTRKTPFLNPFTDNEKAKSSKMDRHSTDRLTETSGQRHPLYLSTFPFPLMDIWWIALNSNFPS